MDNTQVRNAKPIGVSFTVSLSLHLVLLLIIFAGWGTGGSRPSVVDVFIAGPVVSENVERNGDDTYTKPEDAADVTEEIIVSNPMTEEKKAEKPEEVPSAPVMKEEEQIQTEEEAELQEAEETVVTAVEGAFVQHAMEQAVVDELNSDAVSAEREAGTEEIQEYPTVPQNALGEDGPGKALTQKVADVAIEATGSVGEDPRPGIDPYIFAIIKRRITAAVRYPYLARRKGMEGTVLVEFFITEDGNPTNIDVSKSSGHELLDKEAERTIKRASPYPSLKEKIEVPVRFILTEDRKR